MDGGLSSLRKGNPPDMIFFDAAIDLIAFYADRCHHGKEEDILFRALDQKTLSDIHKAIMQDLVAEHIHGRKILNNLASSKERYLNGENFGLMGIIKFTKELIDFYPQHIEKEDKHFFMPVMEYLSKEEQDKMIEDFFKFDQAIIHEKYRNIVEKWEDRKR